MEYGIKSNPLVFPTAWEKKRSVNSYFLFSPFPVLLVICKIWKPVCWQNGQEQILTSLLGTFSLNASLTKKENDQVV